MRQHDPRERRALGALHDGRPQAYLDWAQTSGRSRHFVDSSEACVQAVAQWAEAARRCGVEQAVMVARENNTREQLNAAARELMRALGLLGEERTYGELRLAVGDR